MKKLVLGALMSAMVLNLSAQKIDGASKHEGDKRLSAVEDAKIKLDRAKKELQLTDEQFKKLEKIVLCDAQKDDKGMQKLAAQKEKLRNESIKRHESSEKKIKDLIGEDKFNKFRSLDRQRHRGNRDVRRGEGADRDREHGRDGQDRDKLDREQQNHIRHQAPQGRPQHHAKAPQPNPDRFKK